MQLWRRGNRLSTWVHVGDVEEDEVELRPLEGLSRHVSSAELRIARKWGMAAAWKDGKFLGFVLREVKS